MFTPGYLKEGRALIKGAKRVINYRKDVAAPELIEEARKGIERFRAALRQRSKSEVAAAEKPLLMTLTKIDPPKTNPGLRENVELVLVVFAIMMGLRTFYVQPFKIPTGSMQPTLNGIIAKGTPERPPNVLVRIAQFWTLGRSYEDIVSEKDGDIITGFSPIKLGPVWDGTLITMSSGKQYRLGIPQNPLAQADGGRLDGLIRIGHAFRRGEVIFRGYADLGDQLFVDRLTYNLSQPRRGNIFVFKTNGIDMGFESRSEDAMDGAGQHYIKRLAGVPGDNLRIDAPYLFLNGKKAESFVFNRIATDHLDGYTGYTNDGRLYLTDPSAQVAIPAHKYFALGDNSKNSADSRFWGFVPARNVVGRGLFVFWPFTSHWGFCR